MNKVTDEKDEGGEGCGRGKEGMREAGGGGEEGGRMMRIE